MPKFPTVPLKTDLGSEDPRLSITLPEICQLHHVVRCLLEKCLLEEWQDEWASIGACDSGEGTSEVRKFREGEGERRRGFAVRGFRQAEGPQGASLLGDPSRFR